MKKDIIVSWNDRALTAAACHIYAHNNSVFNWPNLGGRQVTPDIVKEQILFYMKQFAERNADCIKYNKMDEWCSYSGSGGAYFIASRETYKDQEVIDIEITVSPCFAGGDTRSDEEQSKDYQNYTVYHGEQDNTIKSEIVTIDGKTYKIPDLFKYEYKEPTW